MSTTMATFHTDRRFADWITSFSSFTADALEAELVKATSPALAKSVASAMALIVRQKRPPVSPDEFFCDSLHEYVVCVRRSPKNAVVRELAATLILVNAAHGNDTSGRNRSRAPFELAISAPDWPGKRAGDARAFLQWCVEAAHGQDWVVFAWLGLLACSAHSGDTPDDAWRQSLGVIDKAQALGMRLSDDSRCERDWKDLAAQWQKSQPPNPAILAMAEIAARL